MPATYEPIATTTLASAVASFTFSSIPSTYTDLVLICSPIITAGPASVRIRFNGDSATNYSFTYLIGNGTSASSGRNTSATSGSIGFNAATSNPYPIIASVQNYSNTTTFKTCLSRSSAPAAEVAAYVNLYRSTSAITSLFLGLSVGTTFAVGTTFTLYGIKAA